MVIEVAWSGPCPLPHLHVKVKWQAFVADYVNNGSFSAVLITTAEDMLDSMEEALRSSPIDLDHAEKKLNNAASSPPLPGFPSCLQLLGKTSLEE